MSQDTGVVESGNTEQVRADMEAGFNEAITGEVQTETPAAPAPIVTPEPAPVEEPMIAGFKESDLKTRLAKLDKLDELDKVRDSVRGDYGGLKKAIDEIRQAQAKPAVDPRLSKMMAKLESEFPDLFSDIPKETEAPQPTAAPVADPFQVQHMNDEAKAKTDAEVDQRVALKLIDKAHPDRHEVVKTPEFKSWLGTLSPADQQVVSTTWDADVLIGKLDEFKSWNTKRATNAKRLEGAVTPKGVARAAPAAVSERDAMEQGFASVFT